MAEVRRIISDLMADAMPSLRGFGVVCSRLLSGLDVKADPRVGTAGINEEELLVAPEWFSGLSTAEQLGVVLHECLHLLLRHNRRGLDKMAKVWNVAADLEINSLLRRLGYKLPDGGLFPEAFELPDGWEAERYYTALAKELGNEKAGEDDNQLGNGEGSEKGNGQGSGEDQSGTGGKAGQGGSREDCKGSAGGSGEGSGGDSTEPSNGEAGGQADGKDGKEATGQGGSATDEGIGTPVGHARHGKAVHRRNKPLGEKDTAEVGRSVVDKLAEELVRVSTIPGKVPVAVEHLLQAVAARLRVSWVEVLREYLRSHIHGRERRTFLRPTARSRVCWPIVRATVLHESTRVLVLVDESASISQSVLETFLAEVDRIAAVAEVWYVTMDVEASEPRRVYKTVEKVRERCGGTDFVAGFERIKEVKPDLVVLMSDCEVDRWPDQPSVPVIVVRCGHGAVPEWVCRVIQVDG